MFNRVGVVFQNVSAPLHKSINIENSSLFPSHFIIDKMFPPNALTTLLTIWFLFILLVNHILPVQHLISFEIACNSLIVVSLYNTLPSDKTYGNMSSARFPVPFQRICVTEFVYNIW